MKTSDDSTIALPCRSKLILFPAAGGDGSSIGDRVRVLLERVDSLERKLQFSLVEEERARAGKKRRK
jgi:hypothetical protein